MAIEFQCGVCGAMLRTPDHSAGQLAECGSCHAISPVPRSMSLAAPLPSAELVVDAEAVETPANRGHDRSPDEVRALVETAAAQLERFPFTADELASRGARLAGAMLDMLFVLLAAAPGIAMGMSARIGGGAPRRGVAPNILDGTPETLAIWAGVLAVSIVNWFLIAQCGRSLGKLIVGTRIVLRDGRTPGFLRSVVLRHWVMLAIGNIPYIGKPFRLFDVTRIFREGNRCLHDRIAGTWVIKA
jgi:uncharacterized RDD family membrane protein YckC